MVDMADLVLVIVAHPGEVANEISAALAQSAMRPLSLHEGADAVPTAAGALTTGADKHPHSRHPSRRRATKECLAGVRLVLRFPALALNESYCSVHDFRQASKLHVGI